MAISRCNYTATNPLQSVVISFLISLNYCKQALKNCVYKVQRVCNEQRLLYF